MKFLTYSHNKEIPAFPLNSVHELSFAAITKMK